MPQRDATSHSFTHTPRETIRWPAAQNSTANSRFDAQEVTGGADAGTASSVDLNANASASVLTAARTLSAELLAELRHDYPAVYETLHVYEKATRHLKSACKAKEAELLRCISVGEELLEQIDALKQRCERLAHERDEAQHTAAEMTLNPPERLQSRLAADHSFEARAASHLASESKRWEEERAQLLLAHEATCARFRDQLRDALQEAATSKQAQHEAESAFDDTQQQLRTVQARFRELESTYVQQEVSQAAQQSQESRRQRAAFEQQLALMQQQAEVDKETVLAEATVELERLQRALLRAEKELAEHQHASERAAVLLRGEQSSLATAEQASLRRQIRQLEDVNHELELQLHRAEAQTRLAAVAANERAVTPAHRETRLVEVCANADRKGAAARLSSNDGALQQQQQHDWPVDGSANLQRHLQEENSRLRNKLQEVARQAQDDVDRAHDARLQLQQQLNAAAAQAQLLRSTVLNGLEQDLEHTRGQLEESQARCCELQEVAEHLGSQVSLLQEENRRVHAVLDTERASAVQLQQAQLSTQEAATSLQQDVVAKVEELERKERMIVQLQRDKHQLATSLRTLQAQNAAIDGAMSSWETAQKEDAAAHGATVARLEERCTLLQHQLEEARAECAALQRRLCDAEEAVEVLQDAQRVTHEAAHEAHRAAREREETAAAAEEQLRAQQQVWAAEAREAEVQLERMNRQVRDATQQLATCKEELTRRGEALRNAKETAQSLAAEAEQLRSMLAGREESSRTRWKQQYAENTAEREQLLASKEAQIVALTNQRAELRSTLAERDGRVEQLEGQKREVQTALADAAATVATQKGRMQALDEELARVSAERTAVKGELQKLLLEHREKSDGAANRGATSASTTATLRVADLQVQLSEAEEALRAATHQRQHAFRTLLGCLTNQSPRSSAGSLSWHELLQALDEATNNVSSDSSSAAVLSTTCAPACGMEGTAADLSTYQQAATRVLQSCRDSIARLVYDDERRWAAIKEAVVNSYADSSSSALTRSSQLASLSAEADGRLTASQLSPKELHDQLTTSLAAFAAAAKQLGSSWTSVRSGLDNAAQLASDNAALQNQLGTLRSSLTAVEKDRDVLQAALADATRKAAEACKTTLSLTSRVDQLTREVAVRDTRLQEAADRLELRATEAQTERAEWVAKWQESQRHREKEKAEHETALRETRALLSTAEDANAAALEAAEVQAEKAQRQLRADLLKLKETTTASESALHAQTAALTHERDLAAQEARRLKTTVTQLEQRVATATTALAAKEADLAAAEKTVHELRRAHQQVLADGAAAEAHGQDSLTQQIASLQSQLRACQQEAQMQEMAQAASTAELEALRRVNASLESRLAEVEDERAPLRQQLRSLLSVGDGCASLRSE